MAQTDRAWQTHSRPWWVNSKLPDWVFMWHMRPLISHTQTDWVESASSFGQREPTQKPSRDRPSVCECVCDTLYQLIRGTVLFEKELARSARLRDVALHESSWPQALEQLWEWCCFAQRHTRKSFYYYYCYFYKLNLQFFKASSAQERWSSHKQAYVKEINW